MRTRGWAITERAKFLKVGPANIAKKKWDLAYLIAEAPSLAYILEEILKTEAHDKRFAELCAEGQRVLARTKGPK